MSSGFGRFDTFVEEDEASAQPSPTPTPTPTPSGSGGGVGVVLEREERDPLRRSTQPAPPSGRTSFGRFDNFNEDGQILGPERPRAEDTREPRSFGQFEDRQREKQAVEELAPIGQGVRQAERDAMTNFPPLDGPRPTLVNGPSPTTATPQEVPAGVADKATRVQLGKDLGLVGRIGLEVAGGAAGGPGGVQVLKKVVPLASPTLKATARALGVGTGEAAGSLASEFIDPTENPMNTAMLAFTLGGFSDGLASALVGAKRATIGRERNQARLERGAESTMRILGEDRPTAGRLTRKPFIDLFENVVENSLTSTGRVQRINERAAAKAKELLDDFVKKFVQGASRAEVDNLARDIVGKRLESFKMTANNLYGEVDKLSGVRVDTTSLIDQRNKIVAESQVGAISDQVRKIVNEIDRSLGIPKADRGIDRGKMIRAGNVIGEAKVTLSFKESQQLRSTLLGAGRAADDPFASQISAKARLLAGAIDNSMEAAAQAFSPEIFEVYRLASAFWKEGAEVFGDQVMVQLANAKPDQIFKLIMQDDSPQQVRNFRKIVLGATGGTEDQARAVQQKARKVLKDPRSSPLAKQIASRRLRDAIEGERAWRTFQGQFMLNIIRGADTGAGLSTGAGTRTVVGSRAMDRLSAVGEDMLNEIFPKKSTRRLFERLVRAIEMSQADTGIGTGKLATSFTQAAIFFQLMTNFAVKTAVTAVGFGVGPHILGRLMETDKFVDLFVRGVRVKDPKERTRIFIQLAQIAAKHGATVRDSQGNTINPEGRTEQEIQLEELLKVTEARDAGRRANR